MPPATIGPDALGTALATCGLRAGDTLFLHADALITAQFPPMPPEARFALFFDAIQGFLGSHGTIVMPTFSYSATKGEAFDPAATPSAVGALSDYFRRRPGILRSAEPIFSVAASGAKAALYAQAVTGDCFGPGSAFDCAVRDNALILCAGCGFDRITLVHYVEQAVGVDYRYEKYFDGIVLDRGRPLTVRTRYLVRDLTRQTTTDLRRLEKFMADAGLLRNVGLGRVGMRAVRAVDFVRAATELLARDPTALIREGALS